MIILKQNIIMLNITIVLIYTIIQCAHLNIWGFKHYYITEKSYKNTCISPLHHTFNICLQGIKNTHVERPLYHPII